MDDVIRFKDQFYILASSSVTDELATLVVTVRDIGDLYKRS